MRNLNVTLVRALSLSLLLAATVACEDGRDEIANVVPGPIIENQGGTNVGGGSAVGTDPTLEPPDSKEIPPPVEAPGIGPVATPNANPPIISGDPVAVPTPTPFPTPTPTPVPDNVGTLECVTVTNGATLTLSAVVPAGIQEISDIQVRNLTRSLAVTVDSGLIPSLDPVNLVGREEANLVFTVPFSPEIVRTFATGDALVVSFSITDTLGRVLVLEAAPCDAIIDQSQLPPPPPVPPGAVVFDQVSLRATSFLLTQTADTGVVGFGPITGPGAPTDNFDGPGSSASGPTSVICGSSIYFPGFTASPPRLVVNEQNGAFFQINQGVLDPTTTLETPILLAGQRLSVFLDQNGFLQLAITPGNFDELYRINFFEDRQVDLSLARCNVTPGQIDDMGNVTAPQENLEFDSGQGVFPLLESVQALFTLRGTGGGTGEPNNGTLLGAQFTSDLPLPQGLSETADPRFSGVLNLLDVSSNQVRSDISFVVDQVRNTQTQAAIRDLSVAPGDINPVSGNPPFITINGCPATDTNNLVCGRFQINQPFSPTQTNDVLVISGTFTGLIAE